jgi:acetyl-CoA synthetase
LDDECCCELLVNGRNGKQDLEEAVFDSGVRELPGLKEFTASRDFLLKARDYEEAKAGFKWPELQGFNWAVDYFDMLAEKCSNPALMYVDDKGTEAKVSFQVMKERSNKAANFMRSIGLRSRDRVMLMMPSSVELFEVFLGAMKIGCVIIPASTLLTSDDIRDRVGRGRARCIFTGEELTGRVDSASVPDTVSKVSTGAGGKGWTDYSRVDDQSPSFRTEDSFSLDDELLVYFTSGTTAKPKLVLQTHGSYPVGHLTTMYWIGAKKGDVHYNISAPGWAKYAYSSIFGAWNAEATSFLYNYSGKFDPNRVLSVIESYRVRTLCAPPTVWRFLLLANLKDYEFSLRELISAGEPLNPEINQKVHDALGLSIREGFGQTETTITVGFFPGMEVKLGSMGVEAPGFHVEVLDEEYNPAPPKTDGILAIQMKPRRPVGVMEGYVDPREKNKEVFVGGWYLTGDLASRDAEGLFWFVGRADDVFKSSDYRISAFEVESELLAHPSITEVAVVASPDPLRGFVPKAYIMLKPNLSPSKELALEIFSFTRRQMAPYKRPRIIQFVSELPKTVSGKIRRIDLRRLETDQRSSGERNKDEYFEADFAQAVTTRH